MARTNLASYVTDFAARGDETAFVHWPALRPVRWSYRRLAAASWRFARELAVRDIGHGERVVLWGRNSPEWVAAFYGTLLRGAVAVPLDDACSPDFAERVAAQVKPALVVADRGRSAGPAFPTMNLEELEDLVARHDAAPVVAEAVDRSDTAQIVFTSGTTAEPRGVIITHGNVLSNLEPLAREIARYRMWERIVHPVRFLDLLPLSHVFGQFMGIYVPQLLGGEVHFLDTLSPSRIVEAIRRERISVCVAVPRILQSIQTSIERDAEEHGGLDRLREDLASADEVRFLSRWWRFRRIHRMFGWKFWAFISGGATLDPDVEQFWRRLGYAVVQGYGMTETASLVSVNHPFKLSRGSIGKVMPGQDVKLGPGGEILVRGSNVTPGYWSSGATAVRAENEWFPTGDIGEMDADGNLYFKGRKKNVIVTAAGLNVYPEDLEAALNGEPEVKACAVVEIEGAQGPEPAAALIVDPPESAPVVVARANARLAEYQQIRTWVLWPDADFPRTSTQKIRMPDVVAFVRARAAGRPTDRAPGALADVIARVARDAGRSVDPAATLGGDLGMDSLARVELLSAIEDRYQVDLDESAFSAATTVADVERLIARGAHHADPAATHTYPAWAQWWWVRLIRIAFIYAVLKPVAFVMCRCRVRGRDGIAGRREPVLYVANHVTKADAGLILNALPGWQRCNLGIAMSGEMLAGWLRPPSGTGVWERIRLLAEYVLVVGLFNVFPLPQTTGFRKSYAFAARLVEKGYSILVFPEGARTTDGEMHAFRAGAGILATSLEIPVVPVRLDGLWEAKQRGSRFVKAGAVTVSFGDVREFGRDEDASRVAQSLENAVRLI